MKPVGIRLNRKEKECIQQKLCKASFTGVDVNRGFVASITCSNGLFVLMPFPPTKIQLSLKPNVLITELPSSEIRCLASSLSLQEKEEWHHFSKPRCSWHYRWLVMDINLGNQNQQERGCCGKNPHLVDGSSKEAISTIVPSSISFRNLIMGATSTQDETYWARLCLKMFEGKKKGLKHTHLLPTCQKTQSS